MDVNNARINSFKRVLKLCHVIQFRQISHFCFQDEGGTTSSQSGNTVAVKGEKEKTTAVAEKPAPIGEKQNLFCSEMR